VQILFYINETCYADLEYISRKKTGSSCLSKMLHALLADTPLIANLKSEEYLNAILGDCKSLEQRFSKIDAAQVREYLTHQHNEPLKFSAKIKPLIKQESLPIKIVQLLQRAKATQSNGHLWS
jgi:hypothetical protein